MKLVDELRPRKFEQVRGQASAVNFLSHLIVDGQRERNILLHGQVGSGKTTLARIYAAALNCEAYDRETGSPCGYCGPCKSIALHDSSLFLELAAPDYEAADQLLNRIKSTTSKARNGVCCVIFVDEAHALVNIAGAVNALLKPIEEGPAGVVYILATSELDEVPAALRSRFILLAVRPLSREESYRFLSEILRSRGVHKPERPALDLIAGFSDYQPRNMLHCLDQLLTEDITVERVRQVFGSPEVDLLVGYFRRLAVGNSEAALIAFLDWPETTSNKINLIRRLLLRVYLYHFGQINVIIDPLIASIKTVIISEIVTTYRERICAIGLDPKVVWRDMIAFWRGVPRDRDEEASMLDIALFHHIVCDLEASSSAHPASGEQLASSVPYEGRAYEPWGPRRRERRLPRLKLSETHLHYEDVRDIVNTASACTQAYDVRFNAMITLWHSHFGHGSREAASEQMSDFFNRMRDRIKRHDKQFPICRITTQEHDPDRGHCARAIVCVPEALWDDFRSWCRGWKREERVTAMAGEAIEVDFPTKTPRSVTSRDARHKACVRWLLASTDPDEKAWDPRSPHPQFAGLRELLGLGSEVRHTATVAKRQRVVTESAALSKPTLLQHTQYCMYFLSAFDDGAWDQLMGPWERFEYHSRRDELQKRGSEWLEAMPISDLGAMPGKLPETEEALALRRSWSEDPHERPRSWDTWWQQDDL